MKKNQLDSFLSIAVLLLASGIANANIVLGFGNPVQTGNSIDINIVISGLGSGASSSISTYDLDVIFDSSHLSFLNASFGDSVLGNQLDILGFGLNEADASVADAGVLNIFEVSLDDAGELNDQQADSFSLATLTFDILKADSSQLSFSVNDLGDADANLLTADLTAVTVSTVPVPTAFWLMASSLAMLVRKKV